MRFHLAVLTVLGAACVHAAAPLKPFEPQIQIEKITREMSIDKLKQQNRELVQKAVEGLNENLPQKVDDFTQFVGVEGNGTKLTYLFDVDAGPKSDATLRKEGTAMAPRIRTGICATAKRFLQADITLSYRYRNRTTGTPVLVVDVNKTQCDWYGKE
jgi:hypothetical protein